MIVFLLFLILLAILGGPLLISEVWANALTLMTEYPAFTIMMLFMVFVVFPALAIIVRLAKPKRP